MHLHLKAPKDGLGAGIMSMECVYCHFLGVRYIIKYRLARALTADIMESHSSHFVDCRTASWGNKLPVFLWSLVS